MRNSTPITTPTHCVISMANSSKVHCSMAYAKAILTLIKNDEHSNNDTIRTAIDAAQFFLNEAQQATTPEFYLGGDDGKNQD